MKTKSFIAGMLLVATMPVHAATNDLTSALQKGLFEEEANHNLDAAAQAYQNVSAQFDKDRKLAATAIFRLGEVYRKQGKTNEATAQYERIVREFSDQQTLATLSRQNLAGIGAKSEATVPSPLTRTARLEQKRLLEEEIKLVEQDLGELKKLFANGLVSESGVRAKEREVLKLRQQVAALSVDADDVAAGSDTGAAVTDEEEKEIRRIQEMIKNSPDLINAPSGDPTFTPLCRAARLGQLRVARFLLDAGAIVDLRSGQSSPIHNAAAGGHKAMVELLLDRGADANTRDGSGRTPLHSAAENGFQSVVETLLARKADVNAQSKNQETPLSLAAAKGHGAMVELLLAKGAQSDARVANGWTALTWAAFQGHADVVKRLLAKADPNTQDASGRTVLSYAVERGHLDVVRLLLDAKADPNAGQKDLPLAMVTRNKQLEVASLLLDAGAKPDLASKTSQIVGPPGQATQSFMGNGPFGPFTPLQIAVSKNDATMVKLLLKFKADPNAKDPWSQAKPLTFYALANMEMFIAFLDAGADPDARDNPRPLIVAAADQDASWVEPLIAHGANVNVRGSFGNWRDVTPLHVAAIKGDSKSVELLLNAKADANAAAPDGWTALHQAVSHGSKEIVDMLVARGADVNAMSQNGQTPLHWAVNIGAKGIGSAKMIELLVSKGADPNIRNNDGLTPLDFVKSKPGELADLLRQHGAEDWAPRPGQITVTRRSTGVARPAFEQGTNLLNRFTLLEVIAVLPWGKTSASGVSRAVVPFPDFSKVTITRRDPKTGKLAEIPVDVAALVASGDCAKDFPLEWGDLMNIPDREHTLNEQWQGLPTDFGKLIAKCLQRKVTVEVKGEPQTIILGPIVLDELRQQALVLGNQVTSIVLPFRLTDVLRGNARLFSTSDLTRVKVRRVDPATGQTQEWVFNEETIERTHDLWVRDGDVIEVPDKP